MEVISNFNNDVKETSDRVSEVLRKTFAWVCGGLLISALVAYIISEVPVLATFICSRIWVPLILFMVGLIIILELGKNITTRSYRNSVMLYVLFSIIIGSTLSSVFIIYEISTIFSVFLITSGLFGVYAVYGFVTKRDLSSWGKILTIALIGLIIATVVGIFIMNSVYSIIINYIGVIIFCGLIAYDMQKMKEMAIDYKEISTGNIAVWCAISLYLDFINLFLRLLELLGQK